MKTRRLIVAALAFITLTIGNVEAGMWRNAERRADESRECNIKVTSYRFVGTPGTTVRYGRQNFTIPTEGAIEVVAKKRVDSFETTAGVQLIDARGIDAWGRVTVHVGGTTQIAAN